MIHLVLLFVAGPPRGGVLVPGPFLDLKERHVECVAFSRDGKTVAAGTVGLVRMGRSTAIGGVGRIDLWDITGKHRRTLSTGENWGARQLVFGPGTRLVCVGGAGWTEWDAERGTKTASGKTTDFLNPGGTIHLDDAGRLLTLGGMGALHSTDLAKNETKSLALFDRYSSATALGHAGRLAAMPHHQDLDLHDMATGKRLRSILDNTGRIESPAFGPGDKLLAALCKREGSDRVPRSHVRLFDAVTGKLRRVIPLPGLVADRLAFAPDGRSLLVTGWESFHPNGEARLFALEGGEVARLRLEHRAYSIAPIFSPDGKRLALATGEGVRLFTVRFP